MMSGQTVILEGSGSRGIAHRLIDVAPAGSVLNVKAPKRTLDQNAKLWAMLSDVSRAQPLGRKHPPETWKALFCHACGYAVRFEMGLNGEPFPVGHQTSRMSKQQMSELIEFILSWGSENGVAWSDETRAAA